jgi:4-hydroxythreonine-4-phosphate dehydrogenase
MANIKIGITHGDVNSISYELIIKTFSNNKITELFTPVIYGSAKAIAYHRKTLNVDNFSASKINSIEEAVSNRLNLIDCIGEDLKIELGQATSHSGEAALKSLDAIIPDIKNKNLDAIVTAPLNKSTVQKHLSGFTGHTGYLQDKLGSIDTLMLMVYDKLRVGVVTEHIPISQVAGKITKEVLLRKIQLLNKSLQKDFNIRKPKIAVLGLNPHAGDNGIIGNEDAEIILPAVNEISAKGIVCLGPFPADGFFGNNSYEQFDAVLAMYHDQGLIPFKSLSKGQGVNYTAGLPVVRTSPAHGTAYDISGSGVAEIDSFRNAFYLAKDIVSHRKLNK